MEKILKTQTSKEKIDTLTTLKFKILQIKRHQEISIVSSLNCININLWNWQLYYSYITEYFYT